MRLLITIIVLYITACFIAVGGCKPTPSYTVLCEHGYEYDCKEHEYPREIRCKHSHDFHSCKVDKQSATHWGLICPEISSFETNWFDRQDCTLFEESFVDDPKGIIKGGK